MHNNSGPFKCDTLFFPTPQERRGHNAPMCVGPALSRAEVAYKKGHLPLRTLSPGTNSQGSPGSVLFLSSIIIIATNIY